MKHALYPLGIAEFSINVGRGALVLVLGAKLYQATGELWSFAMAFFSEFLVVLLLQKYAGSLVDRKGASKILNIALSLSVVILVILWGSFLLDINITYALLITAILLNTLRPFIRAGTFALLPRIFMKDQLVKANGISSMSLQIGQIVGMALAGLGLERASSSLLVFAIMLGFLIGFLSYFVLGLRGPHVTTDASNISKTHFPWSQYLSFLRVWQLRQAYIIGAFDLVLVSVFNLLLAPVVAHHFNNSAQWLAILDGTFALGAIFAGVLVSKSASKAEVNYTYSVMSLSSTSFIFLGYAWSWPPEIILCLVLIFGICTTLSGIMWNSHLQLHAPEGYYGRVASLKYMINALFVAVSICAVSWANEKSFQFASLSAVGLTVLMLMATFCFLCHHWRFKTNMSPSHIVK